MARNGKCSICDRPKCPFLTVVTRCYKRPLALQKNIRSLKSQTDKDYEQVFIVDTKGLGLAAADQALGKYRDINCGDYIMVLDDDDMIIDNHFIEKLKKVKDTSSPDVIIWRGKFFNGREVFPPVNKFWGVRPVKCNIGSFSYCMSHKLYTKYVGTCRTGATGDFDFINAVFNSPEKPKIEWVKDIFVSCQGGANKGKNEEGEVRAEPTTGKKRRVIRRRA